MPLSLTKGIISSRGSNPLHSSSLTSLSSAGINTPKDWSASQYLKFEDERTQPARDLLSRIALQAPKTVIDLGCGPGNSTAVLAARYPDAHIIGVDSSPDMIRKAKLALSSRDFIVEDLRSYSPQTPVDLLFSNAVFHWFKKEERLEIIKNLMETQPSGGVFAIQVPDNLAEPSHILMRETAADGPWAATLKDVQRDGFQSPQEIYNELKPLCSDLCIFKTDYFHALGSHESVMEWVRGSGLRPFLDPLMPQDREAFLKKYLKALEEAYPKSIDGRVLLRYPRLFVVAVKR